MGRGGEAAFDSGKGSAGECGRVWGLLYRLRPCRSTLQEGTEANTLRVWIGLGSAQWLVCKGAVGWFGGRGLGLGCGWGGMDAQEGMQGGERRLNKRKIQASKTKQKGAKKSGCSPRPAGTHPSEGQHGRSARTACRRASCRPGPRAQSSPPRSDSAARGPGLRGGQHRVGNMSGQHKVSWVGCVCAGMCGCWGWGGVQLCGVMWCGDTGSHSAATCMQAALTMLTRILFEPAKEGNLARRPLPGFPRDRTSGATLATARPRPA